MSDQDWKEKYLAELEQHEKDETRWRSEKHDLQRLLVRACLAAEGQDTRLDALLAELRELARAEDPDPGKLRRLQERLEDMVASFDETRESSIQQLRDILDRLVQPLLDHASGDTRKSLKRFRSRSRKRLDRYSLLPELMEELADLQSRVIQELGASSSDAKPSLLGRLWGRKQDSQQRETAPDDAGPGDPWPDGAPTLEGSEELELDTGVEDDGEDGIQRVGDRLASLLFQIQSQITLPDRAEELAETLLEQARSSRQWDQMQVILDEVAHLIVAAVGKGQRDFEAFLSGLDERLVRIQSQFENGALDLGNWREVTDHYDRELHREIDDMGSQADSATELSGLKSAVQGHVERLNATLDEYREAGAEREEMLREEVRTLQEKVNAMEAESREVKKELQEERRRATTDMLTQLPNREAMEERLREEYTRWERYRESASLAIIDIDYFKDINDTYGHLAGDKVLQLLARAMRENLREPDYLARYGGEEFIVLMPATDAETAAQVLDKLRGKVRTLPFHFRHERVEVTFSGGVTGFMEVEGPYQLLDIADRALYRAKESGRNRILLAEEKDFAPGVERNQ